MRPFGFLHRRRYWALLVCFGTANAHAEPPASPTVQLVNTELQVERDSGAQDCPGTEQLAAELSTHEVSRDGPPVLQHIHVVFSHSAGEYRAELTMSGWRSGRRAFSAANPSCTGVARAAVLAISILLDPDVEAIEEASPVAPDRVDAPIVQPPAPRARPAPMQPVPEPPPLTAPQSSTLWLGAGIGGASDFSGWEALTFELGLRWRLQRASLEVASFVTTPDTEEDQGGETRVMFMGGHGRACLAAPKSDRRVLELNLCGQLSAAAIRGWAKGYDEVESAQYRPWLAAGPMAQISGIVGAAFGWRFTVAVPIAITRESYVVDSPPDASWQAFTTEPWSFWLGALAELPIL